MKIKSYRTLHGWRYLITDRERKIKMFGNIMKYKREAKAAAIEAYNDEIQTPIK